MITHFHWDVETRSEADLDTVGLANYFDHPSTKLLMSNHAEGGGRVVRWEPHIDPRPPAELIEALEDPFVVFHAWGASFERRAARRFLGIDKPLPEWRCEMAQARYLSLPGGLAEAGKILGLKESEAKIKDGKRLIQKFCTPESFGGEETLFGISSCVFRDWYTDPEDWQKFCAYGEQDVVAERAIGKKTGKFPLPPQEWDNWCIEQAINERGWPVGMDLVLGGKFIAEQEVEKLLSRMRDLTGLSNPNSPNQLLPWLQEKGYLFSSLDKTLVARTLDGEGELAGDAREVLLLRGQTSKSSVKKYTNIADMVSADGRLRHQYTFMGAARTGREAAHGVNMGNLPRPVKSIESRLPLAIELVRKMDYEAVKREFENPMDVVASTVRASFRAPEGHQFVVADLSAIENIGACFLSRCEAGLQVFKEGRDPYLDFATYFYHKEYAELEAEYDEGRGNKTKRSMCKPATLGSGFGLGPGKEFIDADGQKRWSGLLGYSRSMGVVMTWEEAAKATEIFRSVYAEIPRTWKDLERAAVHAVRNPGKLVGVGVPQTEKEKESFEFEKRKIYDPILSFVCHGKKVLELKLPSGRSLHYLEPKVEEEEYEYKGKKLVGKKISYYGKEQNSTHWGRISTFGGKIFENADQAWARDILFNGMQEAEQEGFYIVGDTYDEVITLMPTDSPLGVDKLCVCLTRKAKWMPEGIPLKAVGYVAKEYKKE